MSGRRSQGKWWGIRSAAVLLLAALLLSVGVPGGGTPIAGAGTNPLVDVPENGASGALALQSSQWPLLIPPLAAGHSFSWQIAARLVDQPVGDLWLRVVSSGQWADSTDGYHLSGQLCAQPWLEADGVDSVPSCPAGATALLDRTALSGIAEQSRLIGDLTLAAPQYAAFTLDLAADSPLSTASGAIALGLGFTASGGSTAGEQEVPFTVGGSGTGPVNGELSWTGFALLPFAAFGIGAILLGLILAGLARLHRRERAA